MTLLPGENIGPMPIKAPRPWAKVSESQLSRFGRVGEAFTELHCALLHWQGPPPALWEYHEEPF